jgi:hypothetical protein
MGLVVGGTLVRLRTGDLASRQVGDDIMVLDLVTSQYFAVGGSGRTILEVLTRGEASEAEIVQEILSAYTVDEGRAQADVAAFLAKLDAAGLLVHDGASEQGTA